MHCVSKMVPRMIRSAPRATAGREGGERKVKIGAADLSGDLYPGMDEKRNLFLCRIFADCLHLPGEEQIVPVRQIPFTKDQ